MVESQAKHPAGASVPREQPGKPSLAGFDRMWLHCLTSTSPGGPQELRDRSASRCGGEREH